MASIKETVKKINKAWNNNTLTSGDLIPECERLSVGTLGSDYALYGGLPLGKLVVFSGVEHSGKSLSACLAMAQYQKRFPNKCCIYVDAEDTLPGQIDFISQMTGLVVNDEARFLRYDCAGKSAEEIFDDIVELQQCDDIGMIVLDSAPALVSQTDIDNPIAKDNGMRASIAKPLGKFIKRMITMLPKHNNILLIINQVRVDGKTFTGATIYSEPCGYSLNYYPSLKVRFGSRSFTKGEKADLSASKAEDSDGFRLKFSITKSRLGKIDRGGGFLTFRYDGGIDILNDTLEVALKFGFIQRPTMQSYTLIDLDTGEILSYNGTECKFVGKSKLLDFLNNNPEFTNKYIEMLSRHISNASKGVNLLDAKDFDEIIMQENSVNANSDFKKPDEDDESAE